MSDTVKWLIVVCAALYLGTVLGTGNAGAQNRDNTGAHLQSIAESLRALVQVEKERNQRCK